MSQPSIKTISLLITTTADKEVYILVQPSNDGDYTAIEVDVQSGIPKEQFGLLEFPNLNEMLDVIQSQSLGEMH